MRRHFFEIKTIILLCLYVGLGLFSITLGSLNEGNLAVVWLAAGMGLVIMLQLGGIAPYIVYIGSLLVNTPFYLSNDTISSTLAIFCGALTAAIDTTQSTLARNQYQRLHMRGNDSIWPRPHELPAHWLRIALLPCLMTMPFLIALQSAAGLLPNFDIFEFARSTISLVMGDTAGILLILPLYLSWLDRHLFKTLQAAWFPMLGILLFTIFSIFFYKAFMVLSLPLVLYIAVRYQQSGVSIALFILTQICIVGTALGYGQFAHPDSSIAFLNLQLFIFAIMLTMQYHASTQASLQQRQERLEKQVALRTEELLAANTQLLELAHTDELTKVPNRREWQKRCAEAVMRARRYTEPLSIILLDIDHFKKINDLHGHLSGDLVLKRISQLCVQNLRAIDTFARWGGEEFVILLPGTDQTQALLVAEKLRLAIANDVIQIEGTSTIHVTVSLGLTSLRLSDITLDDLISRTDHALYSAKEQGRNRVVCAESLSTHYLTAC
ncbi:sensor domain-containing diguanylate cyclase [Chitinibacter sp. SCUT-21]|uniref:sensor domain-containing diguanylate cyclase n=1 Tax=Chitinibacter sp. SCUT-21 TaxID=2970891 RepID=UPI0035A584E8